MRQFEGRLILLNICVSFVEVACNAAMSEYNIFMDRNGHLALLFNYITLKYHYNSDYKYYK